MCWQMNTINSTSFHAANGAKMQLKKPKVLKIGPRSGKSIGPMFTVQSLGEEVPLHLVISIAVQRKFCKTLCERLGSYGRNIVRKGR